MRNYDEVQGDLDYLRSEEDRQKPQTATFEAVTSELLLDIRELLLDLVEATGEELWGVDLRDMCNCEEKGDGSEDLPSPPNAHSV
jgi:hypothetical protein